jgi:tripeptide aminopeptidase
MVNALLIAMELHGMLPAFDNPAFTEKYEGFYHLNDLSGSVEEASMLYIIRDHDMEKFESKKNLMRTVAAFLNDKYGQGTVELSLTDSYYNMREKILPNFHIIDTAAEAMNALGVETHIVPIRGGTDGARLSFMGLPCPNLCTGGHNFHGRYEYVPVQSMEKTVDIIVKIMELYAQK